MTKQWVIGAIVMAPFLVAPLAFAQTIAQSQPVSITGGYTTTSYVSTYEQTGTQDVRQLIRTQTVYEQTGTTQQVEQVGTTTVEKQTGMHWVLVGTHCRTIQVPHFTSHAKYYPWHWVGGSDGHGVPSHYGPPYTTTVTYTQEQACTPYGEYEPTYTESTIPVYGYVSKPVYGYVDRRIYGYVARPVYGYVNVPTETWEPVKIAYGH
ncbi:hypothetical protein [Sulfoacidibacillus ferrooxidans]|uniref:G5 domain-containing protein n=1 Tax=Sulfoacidibacillus ferrooxidans TaxID=2005001 RepID=A0A9X1VCT5_9BACL|nr:hypothetical protein [Sulfoacidibacillus ferrooxidans]MCI0184955.1 hypothetical protein [Sulfoacidibacillus ferrooxidans]